MVDQADKDIFLKALAAMGGSAGNARLRDTLQWDEETYARVREALIGAGVIIPGRGRGGSVRMASDVTDAAQDVHGGDKVCHWNAGVVLSVAV